MTDGFAELTLGRFEQLYLAESLRFSVGFNPNISGGGPRIAVAGVATKGAEKSCHHRRRKRGLRKGKSRSRECHSRRTLPDLQPIPKSRSDRVVNHSGRKFIWARKACNTLAGEVAKWNKFPRGQLDQASPVFAARKRMKEHLVAKWTRLHTRAEASGIHPTAAFHSSFWKFVTIETSRGGMGGLDDLVFFLRPEERPSAPPRFDSKGRDTRKRPGAEPEEKPGKKSGRPLRRR
jgi:hypothetical protein